MEETTGAVRHSIILKERKNMTVSGVCEIVSFDESSVVLDIDGYTLNIEGTNLKIESFSHENNDVIISGNIDSASYADKTVFSRRRGIFGRMFSNDTE